MIRQRFARWLVAGLAVGWLLATPRSVRAEQVKYVGVHPTPDGGFCYIEAPHVHIYKPHKDKQKVKLLYRQHEGHYEFVGDPVGHGYDGPRHAYYGHHPVAVDVVAGVAVEGAPHHIEFCYLDGPHHHWYAPPADLEFTVTGGAYWFVGTYPPEYERDRKALVRINAIYRPIEYQRPVIEVAPPPAYHGPIVDVHAPVVEVVTPAVEVVAPAVEVRGAIRAGIEVHVPVPTVEVGVGLPGVIVIDDHHHHPGRKTGWHKPPKGKRGKHH
jgi:hypothetical protein